MSGTEGSGIEEPDHTLAGPDEVAHAGQTPPAEVEESDPNADSRGGLAGDMGVSSGRPGRVRGVEEEVTYGVAPTHDDGADDEDREGEAPPEQSAFDDRPEVHPGELDRHESDPGSNPRHGV